MKSERSGWIWFLNDPSVLESWADHIDELAVVPVKQNGVRSIFRTEDSSGRGCFVKIEWKSGLLNFIRNRFFSKAESEYYSGHLLQNCGIPCADYLAWGRRGGSSAVVSRALDGYVSAMEYWYSTARYDEQKKEQWLNIFFDLSLRFFKNNLCHPDFHAANVLLRPETMEFSMIDAYGIRQKRKLSDQDLRDLLHWLLPLRMDVSDDELTEHLERCGILSQKAESFFRNMVRLDEIRLNHDWEKRRRKQILSGNSKFSHTEENRQIRHTLWYERESLPDESLLTIREMSTEEAETEWLDSFRRQLRSEKSDEVPLIFEKNGTKSRLFMISGNKKSSFF